MKVKQVKYIKHVPTGRTIEPDHVGSMSGYMTQSGIRLALKLAVVFWGEDTRVADIKIEMEETYEA
jgi:hypothetical protein